EPADRSRQRDLRRLEALCSEAREERREPANMDVEYRTRNVEFRRKAPSSLGAQLAAQLAAQPGSALWPFRSRFDIPCSLFDIPVHRFTPFFVFVGVCDWRVGPAGRFSFV